MDWGPRNIARGPRNMACGPRNIAWGPRNIARGPRNRDWVMRNMACPVGGIKTCQTYKQSHPTLQLITESITQVRLGSKFIN